MKSNHSAKAVRHGANGFCFFLCVSSIICGAGCGGGTRKTYALDVTPRSVMLAPNQEGFFGSDSVAPADAPSSYLDAESVSWEVVEGEAGGTLQAHDLEGFPKNFFISYTAPQNAGTYHLKATGRYRDGATKTSTATITVQ